MKSLVVVGGGLSGLFAATIAAQRGHQVRLVAEGLGGLSLSHGCIDVWRDGDLRLSSARIRPGHPFAAVGYPAVTAAIEIFRKWMAEAGLPYVFDVERGLRLPTAVGTIRHTAGAPRAQAQGDLTEPSPFHLADLMGFRDFSARLAAAGLRRSGQPVEDTLELPLPPASMNPSLPSLSLARNFDTPAFVEKVVELWSPHLTNVSRLGLPACLGLERHPGCLDALQSELGVDLFEIPSLPPSLPGLRLERTLRHRAVQAGVDLIEGPFVRGEVDGRSEGRRVSGVVGTTAGGPRLFRADAVLLATGGPLHGGWMSFSNGEVQDSVFGLPIDAGEARDQWAHPDLFGAQAYAGFGLRVDRSLRPVDPHGRPFFENLFAAGGILAGADRALEGSRQGIDLATALAAVEQAVQ